MSYQDLVGLRCDVYRNLHKGGFSIRPLEGPWKGRVHSVVLDVAMHNCTFVVQQAGRERVLREHRKNVHAFIRGTILQDARDMVMNLYPVTYDPYKNDSFQWHRPAKTIPIRNSVYVRGLTLWSDGITIRAA